MASIPWVSDLTDTLSITRRSPRLSRQDVLLCAGLLAVLAPRILYIPQNENLPVGAAGLYTLAAQEIAADDFRLPSRIPYYGPGGVPFAYPPVALYVMAAATQLGIPILEYLQWAPGIFALTGVVLFYLVGRTLGLTPPASAVAAAIFGISIQFVMPHIDAAGSVRALALDLLFITIISYVQSLRHPRRPLWILPTILLITTYLTHLAYGVFGSISAVTLGLHYASNTRLRLEALLSAALAGFLAVLWYIFRSLELAQPVVLDVFFGQTDVASGQLGDLIRFAVIMAPAAFVIWLFTRQNPLPLWYALSLLFSLGGNLRFSSYVVCLATGLFSVALVRALWRFHSRMIAVSILFTFGLVYLYLYIVSFRYSIADYHSSLSAREFSLTSWLSGNVPPESTYLLLSTSPELPEWYPYLTERTPIISPWGAEWRRRWVQQSELFWRAHGCVQEQSFPCIEDVIADAGMQPDYLILPERVRFGDLARQIEGSGRWRLEYRDAHADVYRRAFP